MKKVGIFLGGAKNISYLWGVTIIHNSRMATATIPTSPASPALREAVVMRSDAPTVSVCVPVYNAAVHLGECIDSILAQTYTDFELLIVDDGSTDDSRDVVRAYTDPRIRLLENTHDYIGSLNLLLREARGRYVARMDADDLMLPDRLQVQVDYMEAHPEVDILGGGMTYFGDAHGTALPQPGGKPLTFSLFMRGCALMHPTVMMRRASIEAHGLRYEREFIYAEDYRLWVMALEAGLRLVNLDRPLIKYRVSPAQVSAVHKAAQDEAGRRVKEEIVRWQTRSEVPWALPSPLHLPDTSNLLTVVIPFLNEGEEVVATVRGVRQTVGDRVDILVVNDASYDGFPYGEQLASYGVHYVLNRTRRGVAASRDLGVRLCRTPYFLLLDAHMRFYEPGWADYVADELDRDSQRLLCSKSISLQKDEQGHVAPAPNTCSPQGAYLMFLSQKNVPAIDWNNYEERLPTCAENQIPCVLGAGYATSRSYWQKIRGLEGLVHYDCEEAYISIKAWKEGGGCYLLPRLAIGHIYRKAFPYKVHSFLYLYNYFAISELLFPTSERYFAKAVAWQLNKKALHTTLEFMDTRRGLNQELKAYYRTLRRHDFTYIKRLNEICRKVAQRVNRITDDEAAQAMTFLTDRRQALCGIGLFDGLAGALIATLLYVEAGHETQESLATELWERLSSQLPQPHNLSFRTGLAGVGWALIYAASHGLIEDSIDAELALIDRQVARLSLRRCDDLSFLDGLGGIYAYVTARLGYDRRRGLPEATFAPGFLEEMDAEARRVLTDSDDWRTKNFAGQFTERHADDWEILAPEFPEIVELPDYLPNDVGKWQLTLTGVAGPVINKLTNEFH